MHARIWMSPFVLVTLLAGSAWGEETTKKMDERHLAQATGATKAPASTASPTVTSTTATQSVTRLEELTVTRSRPTQAASSETIRARDFELRPHSTTQEILNNLPGLIAGQHAGGGKAMQYFLRGFDNDHGTDIALFVDGLPVNMVSHAHGQGYADLNFLIPETVERVELYKGPYFVQWGDLAEFWRC